MTTRLSHLWDQYLLGNRARSIMGNEVGMGMAIRRMPCPIPWLILFG
jgi:hypothetical protein